MVVFSFVNILAGFKNQTDINGKVSRCLSNMKCASAKEAERINICQGKIYDKKKGKIIRCLPNIQCRIAKRKRKRQLLRC